MVITFLLRTFLWQVIGQLFDKLDLDHDGRISFGEFLHLFQNVRPGKNESQVESEVISALTRLPSLDPVSHIVVTFYLSTLELSATFVKSLGGYNIHRHQPEQRFFRDVDDAFTDNHGSLHQHWSSGNRVSYLSKFLYFIWVKAATCRRIIVARLHNLYGQCP